MANTKVLRDVLEKIWFQKLLHDQSSYEIQYGCGTYRCVAGWIYHLNNGKGHPRKFSEKFLNISNVEGELLFSIFSTSHLQELVLKALEEGRRLPDDSCSFVLGWEHKIEEYNYYSSDWCLRVKSIKSLETLKKFLGIENGKHFKYTKY